MTLKAPLFALAVLTGFAACGQSARGQTECHGEPSPVRVEVVVTNLHSDRGKVTLTLYGDDPGRFLKSRGEQAIWRDRAGTPATRMCFWLPKAGAYALAVYHDEDDSGHFERGGPLGLPREGFGFSNNPHLFFGPPALSQAQFRAGEGVTRLTIRLRYL